MPEMMEIYQKYSENYDELVSAEDYEKNLNALLTEKIDWDSKIVYEAGIGTGRLTNMFINKIAYCYGFDREKHMIDKCRDNLHAYSSKLNLKTAENTELKPVAQKADIFIEGWSFGHTVIENEKNYQDVFKKMYASIVSILKDEGTVVLIETMGTNTSKPQAPLKILNDFYCLLKEEYGFSEYLIRTDYLFQNYEDASRIMGFFFGDEIKNDLLKQKKRIIQEYTGIWIKKIQK